MSSDGVSGNQDAEDVAGAAGVLTCLREGGVLLIGENLQTVMDILGIAEEKEMSAREAMRHRCLPAFQMMRYVVSSRYTMLWAPVVSGCVTSGIDGVDVCQLVMGVWSVGRQAKGSVRCQSGSMCASDKGHVQ